MKCECGKTIGLSREKLAIALYHFDNPINPMGWDKCPDLTRLMCRATADAIIAAEADIIESPITNKEIK